MFNNTKTPSFFIKTLVFFLILSADTIRMSADSLIAFQNILIVSMDSLIGRATQQDLQVHRSISVLISRDSQSRRIRILLTKCCTTIMTLIQLINQQNSRCHSFVWRPYPSTLAHSRREEAARPLVLNGYSL